MDTHLGILSTFRISIRFDLVPECGSCFVVLFQLGRDASERIIELRTEAIDRWDDRDRDSGGDRSILNRSRAGLVFEKVDKFGHNNPLTAAYR
jgi:hypothetical protein